MTDPNKLSRRAILGGLAATSSVSLVGCGGDETPAGPNPDITPLNALLTAEYEAIKAYEAGATILRMPPTNDPQASSSAPLLVIAMNWQNHHRTHATQLASLITSIGGTPVTEASVSFTAPTGFSASVGNVLRLAANKERAAAVAYNTAIKSLKATTSRFLAGTIEGDETQHFIVLYALLKGIVSADPAGLITNINEVVPKPFVAQVGTDMNSLQSIADFTFA